MKPRQRFAGNTAIEERIYQCLAKIHPDDVPKFVRKFRDQPPRQAAHTYRELLVGAYIADLGVPGRYDEALLGKSPDWSVLDHSASLAGVMALSN